MSDNNTSRSARQTSGTPPFLQVTATEFEEEAMEGYKLGKFYSVRIGQIFHNRYQVLRKLGFGAVSTVWLCNDLKSVLLS